MKYTRILLCLFLGCLLAPAAFANGKKVTKIVLDAGHGGKDPGARGMISTEKELTLAIVLRLGKILEDSLRDVQVVYTRTTDVYPSLEDRHEMANRAAADLFISVHINSSPGWTERVHDGYRTVGKGKRKRKVAVYRTIRHRETSTNGTQILVLGNIRNNEKQDAIGEYGEGIVEEPGLLNPNDPQTAIIIAQYSQAFLSRSVSLATKIQQEFIGQGRGDLGVKQQSLEVLAGSAMPGVLVECGFINNPQEETYLNSEKGQQDIALAIFRGIKEYKLETERQP